MTQEDIQKYQELNSERGIPNENVDDATKTGKLQRTTGIRNENTS